MSASIISDVELDFKKRTASVDIDMRASDKDMLQRIEELRRSLAKHEEGDHYAFTVDPMAPFGSELNRFIEQFGFSELPINEPGEIYAQPFDVRKFQLRLEQGVTMEITHVAAALFIATFQCDNDIDAETLLYIYQTLLKLVPLPKG